MRDKNKFSHLAQVPLEDSNGLFQAYLHATEAPHWYLLLDISQDTYDSLRFRNCIFQDETPHLIYIDTGNETHKGKLQHSSRIKKLSLNCVKPIYRTATGTLGIFLAIVLNVLNSNIALTGCEKRKHSNHNLALRKLVVKQVSLPGKKRLIVQNGGFLLPLLAAFLRSFSHCSQVIIVMLRKMYLVPAEVYRPSPPAKRGRKRPRRRHSQRPTKQHAQFDGLSCALSIAKQN